MPEEQKVDQSADVEDLSTEEQAEVEQEVKAQGGDPKKALHAERAKRKEATAKLKAAEEALAKTKPLADEYAQLLPYLPYLLAGKNGRDTSKDQTRGTVEDSEALEFATAMGYEDKDGNPDVGKARRAIDFFDKRTGAKVTVETANVKHDTAVVTASQIRERAYKAVDPDGRLYAKREFIDKVFSQVPPESLTNPDNAVAALIMARGLGGPGDEPVGEPIHTEGSGRVHSKVASVTELGKSIAKIRGKSEKDWAKLQDEPAETGWDLE